MSDSEIIEIEGVGPVLFERSRRARRLSISVMPVRGVRVAIPRGISFARALEVVRPRSAWILRHMDSLKRRQSGFLEASIPLDRQAAKARLVSRIELLASRHGFRYNRICIRSQRTRWGSCSVRNNISLNISLSSLPEELIDYVILHELLHTRIKNHSKAFWKAFDEILYDAKAFDRRLSKYRLKLD